MGLGTGTTNNNNRKGFMFRSDRGPNPTFYTITVTGWDTSQEAVAAWTFRDHGDQQHVYFAASNGAGIFVVDLHTVSLSGSGSSGTGSFTVTKIWEAERRYVMPTKAVADGVTCKTPDGVPLIPFPT